MPGTCPSLSLASFVVGVFGSVLVVGCTVARAPNVSSIVSSPSQSGTSSSTDLLAFVELQTVTVSNAYEAVSRLRPEFLRRRGVPKPNDPSGGLPVVYVDGVKQGGAESLLTIPSRVIVEIRYFGEIAATDQFGPYHAGGVIAVRTRP